MCKLCYAVAAETIDEAEVIAVRNVCTNVIYVVYNILEECFFVEGCNGVAAFCYGIYCKVIKNFAESLLCVESCHLSETVLESNVDSFAGHVLVEELISVCSICLCCRKVCYVSVELCIKSCESLAVNVCHVGFCCVESREEVSEVSNCVAVCSVNPNLRASLVYILRIVFTEFACCDVVFSVKAESFENVSGSNVSAFSPTERPVGVDSLGSVLILVALHPCRTTRSVGASGVEAAVAELEASEPRESCVENAVKVSCYGGCACERARCSNCYVECVCACFGLFNLNEEASCACSGSGVNYVNDNVCSVTGKCCVEVARENILNSLVPNEALEFCCVNELIVHCAGCVDVKERSPVRRVNRESNCVSFDCELNLCCFGSCVTSGDISNLCFSFVADSCELYCVILSSVDCLEAGSINRGDNACGDCAELNRLIILGISSVSLNGSLYGVAACIESNSCCAVELSGFVINRYIIVTVSVDIIECNLVFACCEVGDSILECSGCHCFKCINIVNNEFSLVESVEAACNSVCNCFSCAAAEHDLVSVERDFVCILLSAVNFVCSGCEVCAELRSLVVTCCVCELRNVTDNLDGTINVVLVSLALRCNEVRVGFYLLCAREELNGGKNAVFSCYVEESTLLEVVTEVEFVRCCKVAVLFEAERLTNEFFNACSVYFESIELIASLCENCERDLCSCCNESLFDVHINCGNSCDVCGSIILLERSAEVFAGLCESLVLLVHGVEVKDCCNKVCSFALRKLIVGVDCVNVAHERFVKCSAELVCSINPVVLPLIAVLRNVVSITHKSCNDNACFCKCDYGIGSVIAVAVTGNEITLVAIADSCSVSFVCVCLVFENNRVGKNALVPPLGVYPTTVDLRNHKCEFGSCDLFFCRECEVGKSVLFQFCNRRAVPLDSCGRNACKCADHHCECEHKCKDSRDVFHSIPPIFFRRFWGQLSLWSYPSIVMIHNRGKYFKSFSRFVTQL